MTISNLGSYSSYYATIGDSYLAQSNRIMELVNGTVPNDYDYSRAQNDHLVFSINEGGAAVTLNDLYGQIDDVQTAFGGLAVASDGLDRIQTRLDVISGLVQYYEDTSDLSDLQKQSINEQINYALVEIDQIASMERYAGSKVLDGSLAKAGVYMNLVGNYDIDITQAFNDASTEGLGLARPGEIFLTDENIAEIQEDLTKASEQVATQLNNISSYAEDLEETFAVLKDTIYSSSYLSTSLPVSSMFPSVNSSSSGGDLFLTMGAIMSNVSYDNSYYERVLSLVS